MVYVIEEHYTNIWQYFSYLPDTTHIGQSIVRVFSGLILDQISRYGRLRTKMILIITEPEPREGGITLEDTN